MFDLNPATHGEAALTAALVACVAGIVGLLAPGRRRFGAVRGTVSAALLFGGLALVGWLLLAIDRRFNADELDVEQFTAAIPNPPERWHDPSVAALTDAGREVPLYRGSGDRTALARVEDEYIHSRRLERQLIQTGAEDPSYNCHGWVFTAGRFLLRGRDVETILKDNGYAPITDPRAGDLVVYRDEAGAITHTAVVVTTASGLVLLESKWGAGGRFLHTATMHAYDVDGCVYYRSPRRGHLLAITPAGDTAQQAETDASSCGT
ncbi:MAG: hypothetical protein U0736_02970 [Gemmataceae bacterium]